MEDILIHCCKLENNNYHVGDFLDIWFYKCVIWTNESKDIPEIITIWATPNGVAVEPTPFIGLQVPVWKSTMQALSDD